MALIIAYVFFNSEKEIVIESLKKSEENIISIQNEIILTELNNIRSNILLISKQNILLDYITNLNNAELYKKRLNLDFNNLFKYVKKYSKATYFDISGKLGYKISADNLEIKENLPRFEKKLLTLSKNDIYISDFEVNKEGLKPILKIATMVWDKNNTKKGFLVLDYLGKSLIKELNKLSKLLKSNIILLNKESYSFITMEKDKGWKFIFNNNKKNYKFSNLHPKEWKLIKEYDSTQFINKNGLFTSKKIYLDDSDKSKCWILVSYILNKDIYNKSMLNNVFLIFLLIGNIFLSLLFVFIVLRRRVYLEKLEYSASHDLLTKLPNRSFFYNTLKGIYNHSIRYKNKFALLFIDLDGFKLVNDTYGHEAGDKVLKETANRLVGIVRASDTVSRLGGDEFTVILMNIKTQKDVCVISEKMIAELSKSMNIDNNSVNIGASIGVFIFDNNKELSIDEIIQKSDNAMYMAKKSGKNRCYFSEE
jgi:diguanylate cyclase (GGDEF)-like protein